MALTASWRTRDLEALLAHHGEHCVSLFLPTQRVHDGTRQDPIRFKNLVRAAEGALEERGVRRDEREAILAPARARLDDEHFWQHQAEGLAVFLAPGVHHEFRLPIVLEELHVVGEWFEVKPLLPLLVGDGRYYILALSRGANQLLLATRHAVRPVETPEVPGSLEEALRLDDPERQVQFHSGTGTPASQGRRAAMYHGQGVGTDDDGTDMLRYCQQVDRGLRPVLAGERAPLVMVALDHEQAVFREANTYPHLLPKGVDRNPDDATADELRERAWEVVRPVFREALEAAREQYRAAQPTDRAVEGLEDVLSAAWQGRVDTLFLERGRYVWGRYDADRLAMTRSPDSTSKPGEYDLLDLAARRTLMHGGTVYVLEPDELPAREPAAALLRF